MRVIPSTVVVLACFAATAFAQVPKGNVFIGYSYLNADTNLNRINVNGWNGSLELKVIPFLGAVADVSSHYATSTTCVSPVACPVNLNGRVDSYLFGPRVSASVGPFRPFVHALFGAAHTKASGGTGGVPTDTAFATALGGGLDLKIVPILGWRVQGDLLRTQFFSSTQNNVRLSTGIVIRF